jgi:uncharacterized protein (TIGR03083 family)
MAFTAHAQLANIPVVGRETARLEQTWRQWPDSAWSRPAYCPGWTAADAVAHLATGGAFYAQVIRAGQSGNPQFPWGVTSVAGFREARQAETKKLLDGGPSALLAGFAQGGAQLQSVLEALQEADLTKMAQHPRGLVPIGAWIGMRLLEITVHDWDICQPHETPAHLAPSAVPTLLGIMPEMQLQFLQQRPHDGLDGVYGLHAGDLTWGFTVQGAQITYQPTAPRTCDATLSTDAESMILLTVGRTDVAAAVQQGTLTMQGEPAKGQQLCATLFRAF